MLQMGDKKISENALAFIENYEISVIIAATQKWVS